MTDSFAKHLESIGVSLAESRAATDYAQASTLDDLYFAAGQHLAMHSALIVESLRLPQRGSLVLAMMERVTPSRWERYWRLHNDAFCASAILDLCTVSAIFRQEKRWPDLGTVVDQAFVMACASFARTIDMTPREKARLHRQASSHLMAFQADPERTPEAQIHTLMCLPGLTKERVDRAAFAKAAIVDPSWLDPWALARHFDRLTKTP